MSRELERDIRRRLAPALAQRVADADIDRALDEAAGAVVYRLASLGVVDGLDLPPALVPERPPFTIIDGRELGLWWDPGHRDARPRAEPPRSICLHWTGGPLTRDAAGVHRTLSAREYSIGYVVEGDGDVVQCADDMTVTEHAGVANDFAIGVECANPGYDRSRAREPFLGGRYRLAEWPEEQLRAVVALCERLCERWDIPRVITPERRGVDPRFRGVMGHFNVHAKKVDPGPRPFEELLAAGFEEAE